MKKERLIEIVKALLVIFLYFFSANFQYLAVFLFRMDLKNFTMRDRVIVSTFADILLLILIVLIYRKELIQEFKRYKNNFQEDFDIGLRYWFVGLIIMMISNVLIARFTPLQSSNNETAVQTMIGSSPLLMLITAGILAPIIEENYISKNLSRNLQKTNGSSALYLVSFFGLLHVLGNATTPFEYLYIIPLW